MQDQFDGRRYLSHLRARWWLPVVAVAAAAGIAAGVSLLLPVRYTAKVTLVIDPPAGSDVRASTAVSPIYLESLRTYEHFAASDQLFARAIERFQLRSGASLPFEKLKRRVLRISVPRNTKVMEIAATLPDPRQAHAVALYLAEETIELNRKTNRAGDDELISEARNQLAEAARRLSVAKQAYVEAARAAGLEGPASSHASAWSAVARQNPQLELARAEFDAASSLHQLAERRVHELATMSGLRGERLSLVDPGVVPEQPSWPNIPLNVMAAAALGLLVSLIWLTAGYGLRSEEVEPAGHRSWLATQP